MGQSAGSSRPQLPLHRTGRALSLRQDHACSKPSSPAPAPSRARARSPTRTRSATPPPEARDHGMSVELNIADVSFLGDNFTFIDCPGSIEFQHEGALALTACDAAVVVCEPDPKRVPALQLHPEAARGPRHPALPVPQQDRLLRRPGARHPPDPAARERQAAGAAPDPDLGERRRLGLRRPRARARLRLPQAGQCRGHRDAGHRQGARDGSALQDAGAARRLRRRADGAAALRRAAAARQGVRRPRQGAARGPDRAGAAGLGRERQRHPAAA